MTGALDKLASINHQSSTHLLDVLETLSVYSNSRSDGAAARGTAYFAAFHPECTCLKVPPLAVRFFQDAVKFNVLSNTEAQEISFKMAHCCRTLGQKYDGAFSNILKTGVFRDFLSSELSLNDFLRKELVHGWCGDAFAAASAWPIIPDLHLRAAGYFSANLSRRNILTYGPGPYLRFMNAVDIAVLGAWIGFSVRDVSQALSWLLEPGNANGAEDIVLWPSRATDRIMIPLFSCGFQGAVFGFFTGLSPAQKEQVLKTVLHFGQSVADNYAFLRRNDCLETLRAGRDAKSVASALLRVVSPIEHLVVEVNGRFSSYSLEREDGYWAGYRQEVGHNAADLDRKLAFESGSLRFDQRYMGETFRVTLKPLQRFSS